MHEPLPKRKRGRPKGAKDRKPRKRADPRSFTKEAIRQRRMTIRRRFTAMELRILRRDLRHALRYEFEEKRWRRLWL
jgi:hypothetical protein